MKSIPAILLLALACTACTDSGPTEPVSSRAPASATPAAAEQPERTAVEVEPDAGPVGPPAANAETAALFARPAVLGASVSDGFGLDTSEFDEVVTLSDYLDTALVLAHGPIGAHADRLTFSNPMGYLESQIKAALIDDASVALAPDLMFWMLYGNRPSEAARLERFEDALKRVAALGMPVVLGNVPDIEDPIPLMISADMIPEPETIAAANERLEAWAEEREQVRLLDVEAWFAALLTGDPIVLRGEPIDDALGSLVQDDGLHASSLGTAALALACLEVLSLDYDLDAGVEWDLVTVERETAERVRAR